MQLERSQDHRIELAVVGAHLSGMPLNDELVELGARLSRCASTTHAYRLFALEGTVPAKPGLLRVPAGTGHAIDLEVWDLDAAAFGRFVAAIPSPLGIGTLELADGSRPKGFLVEAVAVEGSRDVSVYGSWRAFTQSLGAAA